MCLPCFFKVNREIWQHFYLLQLIISASHNFACSSSPLPGRYCFDYIRGRQSLFSLSFACTASLGRLAFVLSSFPKFWYCCQSWSHHRWHNCFSFSCSYSFYGCNVETGTLFNFDQLRLGHGSLLDDAEPVDPKLDIIYSKYQCFSRSGKYSHKADSKYEWKKVDWKQQWNSWTMA